MTLCSTRHWTSRTASANSSSCERPRFIFSAGSKAYIGDIETKRILEILDAGSDEIRGIGISNDDRLLYFSLYESESDIWLLDLRP